MRERESTQEFNCLPAWSSFLGNRAHGLVDNTSGYTMW